MTADSFQARSGPEIAPAGAALPAHVDSDELWLPQEWRLFASAVAITVVGSASTIALGMAPALALAAPVFAVTLWRPAFGAYLFLVLNPLIVGIARGDIIPLLRPNELLLALLLLALAIRFPARVLSGHALRLAFNRVDISLLALAVFGSLVPITWRLVRSLPVTLEDALYAVVLWKYLALYWFFRQAVTTRAQLLVCVFASLASGIVVALVAILQVSDLLGVPHFLYQYYDAPFTGRLGPVTFRGTTTIASSFGTADVMIINLLLALALLKALHWRSWPLLAVSALFLAGALAAGSFSGFVGLCLALVAFAVISRQTLKLAAVSLPMVLLGSIAIWPVIAGRLEGFSRPSGLPHSWEGRLANLRDYFLPEIFSTWNWLTGVRPAARIAAEEPWRDWIYIESGYVWLLWIGGLPFLLAFLAFAGIAGWLLWRTARHCGDFRGGVAAAVVAYLLVIVVLMFLDPHLTVRGSADLFFPLLGLALLQVTTDQSMPESPVGSAARWRGGGWAVPSGVAGQWSDATPHAPGVPA